MCFGSDAESAFLGASSLFFRLIFAGARDAHETHILGWSEVSVEELALIAKKPLDSCKLMA
jgi:hypothetical protein